MIQTPQQTQDRVISSKLLMVIQTLAGRYISFENQELRALLFVLPHAVKALDLLE